MSSPKQNQMLKQVQRNRIRNLPTFDNYMRVFKNIKRISCVMFIQVERPIRRLKEILKRLLKFHPVEEILTVGKYIDTPLIDEFCSKHGIIVNNMSISAYKALPKRKTDENVYINDVDLVIVIGDSENPDDEKRVIKSLLYKHDVHDIIVVEIDEKVRITEDEEEET